MPPRDFGYIRATKQRYRFSLGAARFFSRRQRIQIKYSSLDEVTHRLSIHFGPIYEIKSASDFNCDKLQELLEMRVQPVSVAVVRDVSRTAVTQRKTHAPLIFFLQRVLQLIHVR